MNAKRKGSRNEHRTMRLLESAGYACTRAAASLGAWDIIGIGSTDVGLCQINSHAFLKDRGGPLAVAKEHQ